MSITTDLTVASDGTLQPLGLKVLNDASGTSQSQGQQNIVPSIREHVVEIDGRDGEIYFPPDLRARTLDLVVAIRTDADLYALRRAVAGAINPLNGIKTLSYADEIPQRVYRVILANTVSYQMPYFAGYMELTLPFKMPDPYITSAEEHSLSGSGTAINAGTVDAPLIIDIAGPATNPSLTVNGQTVTWTGTLSSGQVLEIDTGKMTAKAGSTNALGSFNGVFPKLAPGNNVVVAGSNVTVKWHDYWI